MAALRLTAPTQGLLPGHSIGGMKARTRRLAAAAAASPASALHHARGAASSPQGGSSSRPPLLPLRFGWVSRFMSPSTAQDSAGGMNLRSAQGSGGSSIGQGRFRVMASAAAPSGGAFARAGSKYRSPPRVCIIGGGFGGLYTAVRLDSLMWPEGSKPQVTLIDQNDRFVFKPMLYEILNDSVQPWEVAPRFDKLLEPHAVRFVQGHVETVETKAAKAPASADEGANGAGEYPRGGRVLLKDGEAVEYDWLVLALGSDATPRGVPGAKDLAIPFVNFDDAMKVRSHLEVLERGNDACVTVVGAGYAGVELAVAVAERLGAAGSVRLVTPGDDIMTGAPPGNRNAAYKALSKLGVSVMTGTRVKSVEAAEAVPGRAITRRVVKLRQGTSRGETVLEADLVLWTGGAVPLSSESEETFHSKPPSGRYPFPRNERGATETESTLRVVNHDRVFALGDTAFMQKWTEAGESAPLPQTAQVAFQQADYVAWNLWASINDRPLLPFRYQHLGSMMSLGKTEGAVSVPLPVPPPLSSSIASSQLGDILGAVGVQVNTQGVTLEGMAGGLIRRAAYLYRQPTNDHRVRVGLSWLSQAAKDAADMASTAGIGSLLGVLAGNNSSSSSKK